MDDTRSSSATSAGVRNRERAEDVAMEGTPSPQVVAEAYAPVAPVASGSIEGREQVSAGEARSAGAELARALGGGRDRLEEGRPHAVLLERAQASRRGASRGGDRGAQRLRCVGALREQGRGAEQGL